jgi:hypothetical protein
MQLIPSIPSSSGKLGGIVASKGRAGFQLRSNNRSQQTRSARQQNARATTGNLAAVWRGLTKDRQQGWAALAALSLRSDSLGQLFNLSGYSLFISCNRNLATVRPGANVIDPPKLPSFPAIQGFTATPTYNVHTRPMRFLGWTLNLSENLPYGPIAVLRATAFHSPAKSHIRASDLRVIDSFPAYQTNTLLRYAEWLSVFGYAFQSTNVTFALNLVDPASGFAGPLVFAATELSYVPPPSYLPLIIEIEGTPIAEEFGSQIEFEGDVIAASN